MSPVFLINFRREAYQRELARSRARVISLGAWLSYFGVMVVIFGLYGLNFAAVKSRTRMAERQAQVLRESTDAQTDWSRQSAQLSMIERGVGDARLWRARLERLATALPANAQLISIEFNPKGASGGGDWNRLVLRGQLSVEAGQDRMRGVGTIVNTLRTDSLLSRRFHSIRLASTSISETRGNTAEFAIECRP